MTRAHIATFSTSIFILTSFGCADTLDRARNDAEQDDNWCVNCDPQTDTQIKDEPIKTPPPKDDPKTTDPVLRCPEPEIKWQYSRVPKTKIYRARDYYCTVDINNQAECWGPAFERFQYVPKNYENVSQMALGTNGLCVLSTYGQVDCHGYPQRPRFNGRFTMRQISMTEDGLVCALGDYSGDLAKLSCSGLVDVLPSNGKVDFVTQDEFEYSHFNITNLDEKRPPAVCGVLLDSEKVLCQSDGYSKPYYIDGPFKKIYTMDAMWHCGLSTDNALKCVSTGGTSVSIDQPLQDLYSAYCGQTEQGNVVCWTPNPKAHSTRWTQLVTETIVTQKVQDFSMVRRRNITDPIEWCAVNTDGGWACSDFTEQ